MTGLTYCSRLHSQADSWNFYTKYSGVLGLCTGAIAAAAVVCSRNTLELVPIAVDAVVVAFRTGMRVADMAQRLEPSDSLDQSWSFVVPGSASAEVVDAYAKNTVSHIPKCVIVVALVIGVFADMASNQDFTAVVQALH